MRVVYLQFAMVETVTTALMDTWPSLRRNRLWKAATVFAVCLVMFLLGLPMATRVGSVASALHLAFSSVLATSNNLMSGWQLLL